MPHEWPQVAAYSVDVLTIQLVKARDAFIDSQNQRIKRSTKTNRADQFCEGWLKGGWRLISAFSVEEDERELIRLYYTRLISEGNFSDLASREAKKCRGDEDAYSAVYQTGKNARLHQAVTGAAQVTLPEPPMTWVFRPSHEIRNEVTLLWGTAGFQPVRQEALQQ